MRQAIYWVEIEDLNRRYEGRYLPTTAPGHPGGRGGGDTNCQPVQQPGDTTSRQEGWLGSEGGLAGVSELYICTILFQILGHRVYFSVYSQFGLASSFVLSFGDVITNVYILPLCIYSRCNGNYNLMNPEAEFMSVQFLGIILRVIRLEVSVYNIYITNQSQTTVAQGGWGV